MSSVDFDSGDVDFYCSTDLAFRFFYADAINTYIKKLIPQIINK